MSPTADGYGDTGSSNVDESDSSDGPTGPCYSPDEQPATPPTARRSTWDGMDSEEGEELLNGTHSGITFTSTAGADSSDSSGDTTTNGAGRNTGAAGGRRRRPQRAAARQQPRIRSAAMQQPRIITMKDLDF